CQARKKEAIHTHINASFSALNVLKFEDIKAKNVNGETVISIASWKRRKFNQHLINLVFGKLGLDLSDEKVSQVYDEISEYGTIAA
ncbi:MAG: IS4 family transposase, partial [Shewanella sp.]|nr:IS4 family transposase [Shewanella sp.]